MDTEATSIVRVCLRLLCFFPFCRSRLHGFLSRALFPRLASLLFQDVYCGLIQGSRLRVRVGSILASCLLFLGVGPHTSNVLEDAFVLVLRSLMVTGLGTWS
jgi:hypothetical protein